MKNKNIEMIKTLGACISATAYAKTGQNIVKATVELEAEYDALLELAQFAPFLVNAMNSTKLGVPEVDKMNELIFNLAAIRNKK